MAAEEGQQIKVTSFTFNRISLLLVGVYNSFCGRNVDEFLWILENSSYLLFLSCIWLKLYEMLERYYGVKTGKGHWRGARVEFDSCQSHFVLKASLLCDNSKWNGNGCTCHKLVPAVRAPSYWSPNMGWSESYCYDKCDQCMQWIIIDIRLFGKKFEHNSVHDKSTRLVVFGY